jgi:hypothetical protein
MSDVNNSIRFKAQLVKTYLSAMFPKSFFKIKETDNLDKRSYYIRGHGYLNAYVLSFTYLNKMFSGAIVIDKDNVDRDLEKYKTLDGVMITDIPKICKFRNDFCKIFATPSKLSISGSNGLEIGTKNVKVWVSDKGEVTITPNIKKAYNRLYSNSLMRKFFLVKPGEINDDEKALIKSLFDKTTTLVSDIDKRESALMSDITSDILKYSAEQIRTINDYQKSRSVP